MPSSHCMLWQENKKQGIYKKTEFGYKLVCSELTTTHYVAAYKIIHVYFSHMIYLMSHVTSLNNTCGWSYKLLRSGL